MTTIPNTSASTERNRSEEDRETPDSRNCTQTGGHLVTPSPHHLVSYHPGPVLPDSLNELVAVAQNLGANILEIPDGVPVTLELAGPATIILAHPFDLDQSLPRAPS